MVQYPKDIADEGGDAVGLDPFGLVGCAVAAQVGDDGNLSSLDGERDSTYCARETNRLYSLDCREEVLWETELPVMLILGNSGACREGQDS
jgi:hypothetical protein